MSDVILRPAVTDDAAYCAAMLNDWIDETPWLPRVHPREAVIDRYRERMERADRIVTVAEAGGVVVGFLALNPIEREVTSLFVRLRGRGIGRALTDHAKNGRATLFLWTFEANEGARRFYSREGFLETDRSDGDNEEGLPDVQYTWTAA